MDEKNLILWESFTILISRKILVFFYSREYAEALRQWHQAYHCFRRSVHCFVEGLEAMRSSKFQESLDLLTESYHFTLKASEVPVSVSSYYECSKIYNKVQKIREIHFHQKIISANEIALFLIN